MQNNMQEIGNKNSSCSRESCNMNDSQKRIFKISHIYSFNICRCIFIKNAFSNVLETVKNVSSSYFRDLKSKPSKNQRKATRAPTDTAEAMTGLEPLTSMLHLSELQKHS